MHWNEWDAPSYDGAVSRGPRNTNARPLPSFELPDGQSYADAADALRHEAKTRRRSQMGTSRDSIFFAEMLPPSQPAAEQELAPAEQWCTEYNQKFHTYSQREVVLGNLGPYGAAAASVAVAAPPPPPPQPVSVGSYGHVRSMAEPQREASPPVSETVEPMLSGPPAADFHGVAYTDVPAAVTFQQQPHAYGEPPAAAEPTFTVTAADKARAAEKRSEMHKKQLKKKLRRKDTTSRDMPDTAIAGGLNAGRTPFHCYGRGSSAHALPGGEMHPSQSLRQGCGRDRKTHNVKAATFARSAGGKPEYQQVYSSALYGRDAMKDFDDYIRSESCLRFTVSFAGVFWSDVSLRMAADHRVAVKKGEDPLTRVAWPPAADDESTAEVPPHRWSTQSNLRHSLISRDTSERLRVSSYRQTQRQNNQQALHELDSWADAHDVGTQKWLERWQLRQHDELGALELWDRLATPAAHNQQPKIRKQSKEGDAAGLKARAEAHAWASAAAAPAPAAPSNSSARARVPAAASNLAASNASALAASMPPAVRGAVTGSRVSNPHHSLIDFQGHL